MIKTLLFSLFFSFLIHAQQHNVLLIIADDMGIDNHALYNSSSGVDLPNTPNIDGLKSSGVLFKNAYAHPTCSPTRASILTGRQPYHHGVSTAVSANDGQLMAAEFTLPRAFEASPAIGYSLAHFGKWHLTVGRSMENDPQNIGGWPYFSGSLNGSLVGGNGGSGSYEAWTKTVNGVTGVPNATTTYATTDTTNDTIAWINAQGSNPWFAWVAYNAPHSPFHKPPNDLHSYDERLVNWDTIPVNANITAHFNAAVEAMDTEIGRLFSTISPTVLANTWVIFIGDNGTPPQAIQSPYTGNHGKDTLYEGGVRVPLLISGPEVVSPDREEALPVHAIDLYATILELAGIDASAIQPVEKPTESRSLLPIIQNLTMPESVVLSQRYGSAITDDSAGTTTRLGDYKFIQFADGVEELYYLPTDENEASNLLDSPLSDKEEEAYQTLKSTIGGAQAPVNALGSPLETQWQKIDGGEYARIYETQFNALNGITNTTWDSSGLVQNGGQSIPAYAGIESIRVSANWVYVKGSGLPHYTMGPWYFDEAKTRLFVNYPSQWDMLTRLPRRPEAAAVRSNTNFGPIAIWVNSAIIHNQLDAFYWNGTQDVDVNAQGTEYWTRNAYLAEGPTFDPAGAHQPFTGESHHHINPYALRHELGDHMEYNPTTHTYAEATTAPSHSPILGWSFDGYPIYGPYGYDNPSNPTSSIRRMQSGYTMRDGQNGTTDLRVRGRVSIPQWAIDAGHGVSDANDTTNGPDVDTDFPLGWYLQDHAYLGNLGYVLGQDFDLDICNGRWSITPEFPEGTYAYFTTLDENNLPAFPYIIGRQYYGVKQGGNFAAVSTIGFNRLESPIEELYAGGPLAPANPESILLESDEVTIVWNMVEGGQYTIQETDDLEDWDSLESTQVISNSASEVINLPRSESSRRFYRASLESLAPYQINPYE